MDPKMFPSTLYCGVVPMEHLLTSPHNGVDMMEVMYGIA
jgi:hypothetical protein